MYLRKIKCQNMYVLEKNKMSKYVCMYLRKIKCLSMYEFGKIKCPNMFLNSNDLPLIQRPGSDEKSLNNSIHFVPREFCRLCGASHFTPWRVFGVTFQSTRHIYGVTLNIIAVQSYSVTLYTEAWQSYSVSLYTIASQSYSVTLYTILQSRIIPRQRCKKRFVLVSEVFTYICIAWAHRPTRL
jgi:hypothetical protein